MPLPTERQNRLESLWDADAKKLPQGRVDPTALQGYDPMKLMTAFQGSYGTQNPVATLLRMLQLGQGIQHEQGMGQDDMLTQLIQALLSQQAR